MVRDLMLDFALDAATLLAVRARVGADGDASAFDDAQRSEAFAGYLRARAPQPVPDVALRWRTGRRMSPAAARGKSAYVHLGAVRIAHDEEDSGLLVCSFGAARARHAALFARARRLAGALPSTPSARLLAAFQNCGVFVYAPPGLRRAEPLQLIWNYPEGLAEAVFPYVLVHADAGAELAIVERHLGAGDVFLCGATQLVVGAGARCDHATVQRTGETAVVQQTRTVVIDARGSARCTHADLGANFARLRAHHELRGEGAELAHAYASLRSDLQRADAHVVTRHRARGTTARHVRRYLLGGRSRARHVERVVARDGAQARSDVEIAALLFSPRARIDVVPERAVGRARATASERASIGTLDAETVFYLRTRGIPAREARRMTALAFLEPAVAYAREEALREEIRLALDDEIDRLAGDAAP